MMAVPKSPQPRRGVGPFQQLAQRRGREIEKLQAELDQARAQLAEIGETREEWRFDDGNGWFTVSRKPLSAADVQHLKKETGRPVEHRLAGEWREVPE